MMTDELPVMRTTENPNIRGWQIRGGGNYLWLDRRRIGAIHEAADGKMSVIISAGEDSWFSLVADRATLLDWYEEVACD